ncbi:MAG TPA: glycosyltransferase [Vicinamibacterales bacterium]|nr:glycosyltransferase [Vicinamibacterales bacterium]
MPSPSSALPTVSVCIPTYRGALHLRASIDSVLAQTFGDFEVLIIDDNSPDDTFEIAAAYGDSRVRCLRNPRNLGPEGNWNRCLDEATGRYVKLLPQDDVLAPGCLQRQVEVLEGDRRQEIALVFCARTIIDGRGRQVLSRRTFGREDRRITGATLFRRCLWRGTNVIGEPGGVLFRRALARAVGPFDASYPYVVDLDFWLRLLAHGDGYYIAVPLVSFRISPGAWSVAIGASQAAQFRGLAAKMVESGRMRAGVVDLAAGRVLALLNNVGRLLLYRFLFARG